MFFELGLAEIGDREIEPALDLAIGVVPGRRFPPPRPGRDPPLRIGPLAMSRSITAVGAIHAFSRRPLSRASRPFTGLNLKDSKGFDLTHSARPWAMTGASAKREFLTRSRLCASEIGRPRDQRLNADSCERVDLGRSQIRWAPKHRMPAPLRRLWDGSPCPRIRTESCRRSNLGRRRRSTAPQRILEG
jgi:hypothetical protein